MTPYRTLISSLLLTVCCAMLAPAALAARGDCSFPATGSEFWGYRADRMAQHHKMLHDKLQLTADQEVAWKRMVDAEAPMARGRPARPDNWAKLTTPERAEAMLERMKERQGQMANHLAALKDFYTLLSPQQQETFDQVHANPRHGMRGKRPPRTADSDQPIAKP